MGDAMTETAPSGTVPERIFEFLEVRPGASFCDDSIAKLIGINRYMAQQSTLPFGLTRDFKRTYVCVRTAGGKARDRLGQGIATAHNSGVPRAACQKRTMRSGLVSGR
jgi:hypothetical protein